jgi:two-component sensor histidine kinase
MDRKIRATQLWPLWWRITITVAAITIAYLVQIPLERQAPGEPFLLFFMVVISGTLAFGSTAGFVAVGLSTLLTVPFLEPLGSYFVLTHAWDLAKVELYVILSSGCVLAVSRVRKTLIAVSEKKEILQQLDENKSLLLRETVHGVANNFASIAALLTMKSYSISDIEAKRTLDAAVEQVKVMARVHRRLRARDHDVSVDSVAFIRELCDDLKKMVSGRQIHIEREVDSLPLNMEQAVPLGLIVNELVTNAIKHAFPNERGGRIRVRFERLNTQLRLSVDDDGVGFMHCPQNDTHIGQGQELVRGFARELGGDLEIEPTTSGSSCRVTFPYATQRSI